MPSPAATNPNFLPGALPKFTNFDKMTVKNAYNNETTASAANTIDTTFFNNIKSKSPDLPPNVSVTFDVDSKNALNVQKIKCIYPANPKPPSKFILAYRIFIDNGDSKYKSIANNQCMTQPPQLYTPSYMPNCMSVCTIIPNTPSSTSKFNYSCNDGGNNNDDKDGSGQLMYIPRGGWMGVGMNKQSLLQSMSNSPNASNIIDSTSPLLTKNINVTTSTGAPVYIANNNSTKNLNTWTKLQDLCR
jgi:hypothetical protein